MERDESDKEPGKSDFCFYFQRLKQFQAMSNKERQGVLTSSLEAIQPSALRIAAIPNGPHDILRLIKGVGYDCFVEQWAFDLSNIGVALDFDFPVIPVDGPQTQKEIAINLFEDKYSTDFQPLSGSSLARASQSQHPTTRAYLHHLLWSHEMTANILLTLHNVEVMWRFMHNVGQVLKESTESHFQDAVASFEAAYSDRHGFINAARLSWAKVNGERGKGRSKNKPFDGDQAKVEAMTEVLTEPESSTLVIDQSTQG